ncbi:MAG: FAD-dependent oxidoreductase [Actinomycetota bacterium]
MSPDRYDVVVAGAGIAGLSLAALLAADGRYSVLLVEKDGPGGRFAVTPRDGYRVDFGVHACLLGGRGAVPRVLRRCGVPLAVEPAGAALYHNGRLVPFLGRGLSSIARQRALGSIELSKLGLEAVRSGDRTCDTSIDRWVKDRGASPRVERLLRSLSVALLPSDRFDRASAGEVLGFLKSAMLHWSAMGYPRGGWGAVLDALTAVIEGAPRCRIRLGSALERVLATGGRVRGAVIGGEEVAARAVVLAFPPQEPASSVVFEPALDRDYLQSLAALEGAYGVFVDMGLASPLSDERRLVIALDPSALLWLVSNVSPEVAPPGRQLLQLFSPVRKSESFDAEFVRRRAAELIGLAGEVFGSEPGEEWRRVSSGLITSVVPFTDQSRPHRPGIEVPGVEGAFLIGDGVRIHGLGGDMAARSALEAVGLLESYLATAGGPT